MILLLTSHIRLLPGVDSLASGVRHLHLPTILQVLINGLELGDQFGTKVGRERLFAQLLKR